MSAHRRNLNYSSKTMSGRGSQEAAVVFQSTFEGLWVTGLKGRVTESLTVTLQREGLILSKLEPAYPLVVWKRCLAATVSVLYPQLAPDQAYRQLGELFMSGFLETFVGRAMLPLLRLLGPRRSLERLTRSLRSGNNFSQTRVEFAEPNRGSVWLNDDFGHPSFVIGIMERGLHLTGTPSFRLKLLSQAETGALFEFRFE
jgi:uncharacterized protein (TIGR02265 family)